MKGSWNEKCDQSEIRASDHKKRGTVSISDGDSAFGRLCLFGRRCGRSRRDRGSLRI
jgi:hypothetical protein